MSLVDKLLEADLTAKFRRNIVTIRHTYSVDYKYDFDNGGAKLTDPDLRSAGTWVVLVHGEEIGSFGSKAEAFMAAKAAVTMDYRKARADAARRR